MYQCRCCYCGQIFESKNKRAIDCGVCDKTSDLSRCSQEFLIMMNRNQYEMIRKLKAALEEIVGANGTPVEPKHVSRSAIIEIAKRVIEETSG